tara:strand:+ start:302 stop:784 length:483 start_codon:yes stop_codon:yes gene_type:complete
MNKKGAIEFSMTTIMVIIVGVVVLSLGIAWVMGSFEKIGDITDTAFESAKEQLGAKLTAQDPMGISPSTVNLKVGESKTVAVGYLNAVTPSSAITGALSVSGVGSVAAATLDTTQKTIQPGEILDGKIIVKGNSVGQSVASVKFTIGGVVREQPLVIIVE